MDQENEAENRLTETVRKLEAFGIKTTRGTGSFGFVSGVGSHQKRGPLCRDRELKLANHRSSSPGSN